MASIVRPIFAKALLRILQLIISTDSVILVHAGEVLESVCKTIFGSRTFSKFVEKE